MNTNRTLMTVLLSLLLPAGGVLLAGEQGITSRTIGGYTLTTFSSGDKGTENHSSGFEVSEGGKVILHKANTNATSDVLVGDGTVGLDGSCLRFCYGEVGDGLDDAYIHAVRICSDKVEILTSVVVDDEGIPSLRMGAIPRGWDEKTTKEEIQRTFDWIFSRK